MGLLLTGETSTLQEWDVKDILNPHKSNKELAEYLSQFEWDNTIGPNCNGMTYLEIEQFNNTYNNF